MTYCNQQPGEISGDASQTAVEEKSRLVFPQQADSSIRNESMGLVQEYKRVINERILENTNALNQIRREFDTEKNEMNLSLGGEIFQLSKKNLQLKAKISDLSAYQGESLEDFKTKLNEELEELEAAIEALKVKSAGN